MRLNLGTSFKNVPLISEIESVALGWDPGICIDTGGLWTRLEEITSLRSNTLDARVFTASWQLQNQKPNQNHLKVRHACITYTNRTCYLSLLIKRTFQR